MLAAALTGCTSDEEVNNSTPVAARVSGEIVGTDGTRASGTVWDNGDAIGVSVTSVGATTGSNVKYTYNGSCFDSAMPIHFNDEALVTFSAYYPFTGTSGTAETTIAASTADQSKQKQFDFLYASGANAYIASPEVQFYGIHGFSHCMSQLTFTFKAGNADLDLSGLTSYTVSGLVMDGTFNPSTGIATASSTAATDITTDLTGKASGSVYTAEPLILFPQKPADNTFLLSVVNDGITYTARVTLSTEALTPGCNVNYSVVVSKSEVVVFCDGIFEWETEDGGDYSPPFFNPNVEA